MTVFLFPAKKGDIGIGKIEKSALRNPAKNLVSQ